MRLHRAETKCMYQSRRLLTCRVTILVDRFNVSLDRAIPILFIADSQNQICPSINHRCPPPVLPFNHCGQIVEDLQLRYMIPPPRTRQPLAGVFVLGSIAENL